MLVTAGYNGIRTHRSREVSLTYDTFHKVRSNGLNEPGIRLCFYTRPSSSLVGEVSHLYDILIYFTPKHFLKAAAQLAPLLHLHYS
jgi:hypothetical protein